MPDFPLALPPLGMAGGSFSGGRRRRRGVAESKESDRIIAASYSRYSTDMQRDASNADQQRECQDAAEKNGHRLLPEFEFADAAVSGTKLRRAGLDAMLRAAEAVEFQVLYLHSLSRLGRELAIMMPILKRLVVTYKVRVISVSEGIDSERVGWDLLASILCALHEQYVKELAQNVFRGQEGAVLSGYCVGDYCFGYSSESIPGSETIRKGRDPKPRKRYVIDEATAPWVVRIFYWFVVERRSISWIVRELNRCGVPKDHRATTPNWHHQLVVNVLGNLKYIGFWPWGEDQNVRDPETGAIRQEPRPDDEIEKWTRHFPELQLVDKETFDKAQQLLEENRNKTTADRDGKGRWNGRARNRRSPSHLLSGIIKCGECGRTFHVGGTKGKYLFCPGYKQGVCTCQTTLQRVRAEQMILDFIGRHILSNSAWRQAVQEALQKAWHTRQSEMPAKLRAAQTALADADQRISRLVDRIEEGTDDPDVRQRLVDRRQQRRELRRQLERLHRAAENVGPEPTEEWLDEQLASLGECLRSTTPAAAYALRELVGSEITVSEISREGRKRHYLQGRFRIQIGRLTSVLRDETAVDGGEESEGGDGLTEEIVIDFVDANPNDELSIQVKALDDEGWMRADIGSHFGLSKNQVCKLLKRAHQLLGTEYEDGRHRRKRLSKKQRSSCRFEELAEPAWALYQQGLLMAEIADRLGCDRATATKAIDHAHAARGLQRPDGRSRRKNLDLKQRHPPDYSGDEANERPPNAA